MASEQATRACVFVWIRPPEEQGRGGVGGLEGGGVEGFPLAWAASVCMCRLWPATVWACGGAGSLGGGGVGGLSAAAGVRSKAVSLSGVRMCGFLFCILGLI